MYVLGHTGITLAAAVISSGIAESWRRKHLHLSVSTWVINLNRFIDIRFLFIGSLLPDIIDKPVGYFLFQNGRTISHTLVFSLVLLLSGIWAYRARHQRWLLPLGIGSLTHLILDQMWLSPQTLFWPFFNWLFPRYPQSNWFSYWLDDLTQNRTTNIEEIIGLLILLGFAWLVIARKKIKEFITRGVL